MGLPEFREARLRSPLIIRDLADGIEAIFRPRNDDYRISQLTIVGAEGKM